jgi:hypothetical protein
MAGKALETVFFQRDAKRSTVWCFTKWAWSSVAFALQLERIEETMVPEHLLEGDTLFELLEGKDIDFLHGQPPVVGGSASTLQEEKILSNQWVVVDGCRLVSMIESMSNNNQKEMTISELAQEMRNGFKEMREKFSGVENRVSGIEKRLGALESYMRQGFELMDAKIDAVDQKIEHKIEFLQEGLFTHDEKKSLFNTVKLVNDHLADNVVGRMDITLTREEYDMLMESVRLPNRFLKARNDWGGVKKYVDVAARNQELSGPQSRALAHFSCN